MLADLTALTPSLVVCAAFLIGVALFLRRQMGTKRIEGDDDAPADISADGGIPDPGGSQPTTTPDQGDR